MHRDFLVAGIFFAAVGILLLSLFFIGGVGRCERNPEVYGCPPPQQNPLTGMGLIFTAFGSMLLAYSFVESRRRPQTATDQPPRRHNKLMMVIALATVSIIVISAVGYVVITDWPNTTSTVPTTSTVCVINAQGYGTYLHVVSDSTQQPVSGVSFHFVPIAYSCLGYGIPTAANYTTNSTGWIFLYGVQANYLFQSYLTYAGRSYNVTLPQRPGELTYATLQLPSGNLTIMLCLPINGSAPACSPYNRTGTSSVTPSVSSSTSVSSV
jgi:hypothetical protein